MLLCCVMWHSSHTFIHIPGCTKIIVVLMYNYCLLINWRYLVPQKGYGFVAVPAKRADRTAIDFPLLSGADEPVGLRLAVDHDGAVGRRIEAGEADMPAVGMDAEQFGDDGPDIAVRVPRRVAEDVERRISLQRLRPKLSIIGGIEIAEDMQSNEEAAGMLGLLVGEFRPQSLFKGAAMLDPARPVRGVAVAGFPFEAGARTGGALLQREGENRRTAQLALHHCATDLAAVVAVDQEARALVRMLDAGRKKGAALDNRGVIVGEVDMAAARQDARETTQGAATGVALAHLAIFARIGVVAAHSPSRSGTALEIPPLPLLAPSLVCAAP